MFHCGINRKTQIKKKNLNKNLLQAKYAAKVCQWLLSDFPCEFGIGHYKQNNCIGSLKHFMPFFFTAFLDVQEQNTCIYGCHEPISVYIH